MDFFQLWNGMGNRQTEFFKQTVNQQGVGDMMQAIANEAQNTNVVRSNWNDLAFGDEDDEDGPGQV